MFLRENCGDKYKESSQPAARGPVHNREPRELYDAGGDRADVENGEKGTAKDDRTA